MNVYKYNEKTKEYTGVETAQLDPLESKAQGKEIYLLPANATFIAPLVTQDGYVPVWGGNAWEYKEDNRGKEYWLPGDEYGTPARTMKELGELPEGAVFEAPEKPLSMMIEEKTAAFKAARNAEEIAPIEWNGNLFDYDADSRDRLRIKRQNIEDNGGTGTIKWTLADNSFTVIGLADFIGINNAASKRSEALHYKYNVLKAQAEAATTKEELESIVW